MDSWGFRNISLITNWNSNLPVGKVSYCSELFSLTSGEYGTFQNHIQLIRRLTIKRVQNEKGRKTESGYNTSGEVGQKKEEDVILHFLSWPNSAVSVIRLNHEIIVTWGAMSACTKLHTHTAWRFFLVFINHISSQQMTWMTVCLVNRGTQSRKKLPGGLSCRKTYFGRC